MTEPPSRGRREPLATACRPEDPLLTTSEVMREYRYDDPRAARIRMKDAGKHTPGTLIEGRGRTPMRIRRSALLAWDRHQASTAATRPYLVAQQGPTVARPAQRRHTPAGRSGPASPAALAGDWWNS